MKRLSWSKLITLTALVSLGIVTPGVATADGPGITVTKGPAGTVGTLPKTSGTPGARIPATQAPGQFKAWEGFTTTNYLNTEQYVFTPPSASTAAGPVNIITIVNRRIAIYDNPNAIVPSVGGGTRVPQVLSPTSYLPTSEALLDAWMGESVLNNLCPTGRDSNISCLVDNASVRYDQMQGRYLVLLTVTDTGVETSRQHRHQAKKSELGSVDLQVQPVPVSGHGRQLGHLHHSDSADRFHQRCEHRQLEHLLRQRPERPRYGRLRQSSPPHGTVGPGNINSIPGNPLADSEYVFSTAVRPPSPQPARLPLQTAISRPARGSESTTTTSRSLRRSSTSTISFPRLPLLYRFRHLPEPAFASSRRAAALLNWPLDSTRSHWPAAGLAAANQYAPPGYWTWQDHRRLLRSVCGSRRSTGAPVTRSPATRQNAPWTLAPITAPLTTGQAPFCEPARVRGRAAASYTNSMTPAPETSQNYIECVVSTQVPVGAPVTPIPQNIVYIQPVLYTPVTPINPPANTNFAIPYYVSLVGDGTTNPTRACRPPLLSRSSIRPRFPRVPNRYLGWTGGWCRLPRLSSSVTIVRTKWSSAKVTCTTLASVVLRRLSRLPDRRSSSTVFYDVIQKLTAGLPCHHRSTRPARQVDQHECLCSDV